MKRLTAVLLRQPFHVAAYPVGGPHDLGESNGLMRGAGDGHSSGACPSAELHFRARTSRKSTTSSTTARTAYRARAGTLPHGYDATAALMRREGNTTMNLAHRRPLLVTLGGSTLTAGCRQAIAAGERHGTYCFCIGKSYGATLACTPALIPSGAIEADAKRFEPAPGRMTGFLVRKRWGDSRIEGCVADVG